MDKIRLFYLFSLLILILLFVLPMYFIFKPTTPEDYISRSSEHEFVELGKTLSFKLQHYNPESEDKNYIVAILLNDKEIRDFTRTVKNHSYLKYSVRFEDSERIRGNFTVLIYKEGESEPIDTLTYSLGAKQ